MHQSFLLGYAAKLGIYSLSSLCQHHVFPCFHIWRVNRLKMWLLFWYTVNSDSRPMDILHSLTPCSIDLHCMILSPPDRVLAVHAAALYDTFSSRQGSGSACRSIVWYFLLQTGVWQCMPQHCMILSPPDRGLAVHAAALYDTFSSRQGSGSACRSIVWYFLLQTGVWQCMPQHCMILSPPDRGLAVHAAALYDTFSSRQGSGSACRSIVWYFLLQTGLWQCMPQHCMVLSPPDRALAVPAAASMGASSNGRWAVRWMVVTHWPCRWRHEDTGPTWECLYWWWVVLFPYGFYRSYFGSKLLVRLSNNCFMWWDNCSVVTVYMKCKLCPG